MRKETFLECCLRKIKGQRLQADTIPFQRHIFAFGLYKKFKNLTHRVSLIEAAMCDPKGLGGFNLKLDNAHVQKQYYDIFYTLYCNNVETKMGGGQQAHERPVCIDCGAHAGLISDILLDCGAIVHAFEPNRTLFPFLKAKYENNPNITLNQAAVSNKDGVTNFLISDSTSQGNRISEVGDINGLRQATYQVKVVDLVAYIHNEILSKHDRIYLLKLDVEGAEFDIMEKIMQHKLYEKIDYIACETHARFFEDGEERLAKLRELITKAGASNILLDWI